jgi:hypothetical protein
MAVAINPISPQWVMGCSVIAQPGGVNLGFPTNV